MKMLSIYLSSLLLSLLLGYIIIPKITKKNIRQTVSNYINERHIKKNGTPTMGGIIFILTFIIILLLLLSLKKITMDINVYIIIFSVVCYSIIGYIDDYKKVKNHDNKGLSIKNKFILEILFSIFIYILYRIFINNNTIVLFNYTLNIKYFYGIFIFLFITTMTNAVNITDGLDGLSSSLGVIIFLSLGLLIYKGYFNVAIICFIISASLLGFLYYNINPAKIFMGDLGSLSIGALLAVIGVLTKTEFIVILISLCYILELLSSFIQIVSIKFLGKKVFLKAPYHHHLEQKNYDEISIVKIFFYTNLIINLLVLIIEYYK